MYREMSWARGRVAATVFCVVRGVRVLRRRAVLKKSPQALLPLKRLSEMHLENKNMR